MRTASLPPGGHTVPRALVLLALLVGAASCVETRTVFQSPNLTAGVPPAAKGVLGYVSNADTATHQTVCGNCHIDPQARWKQSKHAHAWLTLQQNNGLQPVCEACHSVNGRGNPLADTTAVGFLATGAARYHDVQCENCHGPGLTHVQNPTFASAPLASVNAGLNLGRGCGDCHNGTHHGFVNEWAQSPHAQVLAPPAGRPECQGCHIAQGALKQFNVQGRYLERDSARPLPITCAVCHDPHGPPVDTTQAGSALTTHQLRYSISSTDPSQNLCMRCHNRRGTPDPASALSGPHAPQTALLEGAAGWWPPNMPIQPGTQIIGTHGSAANPRMCATCHVQGFTVTDKATGKFVVKVTGHLFLAIPCPNGQGVPTTDTTCAVSQRLFTACAASGCHGTPQAALTVFLTADARIHSLNTALKAMLAQVPATEFSNTDNRYSTAEGAQFNARLADMGGSVVHNPFLLEALLRGSISQVNKDYGIAIPPSTSLVPLMKRPPGF